jgi:hypothetical protein
MLEPGNPPLFRLGKPPSEAKRKANHVIIYSASAQWMTFIQVHGVEVCHVTMTEIMHKAHINRRLMLHTHPKCLDVLHLHRSPAFTQNRIPSFSAGVLFSGLVLVFLSPEQLYSTGSVDSCSLTRGISQSSGMYWRNPREGKARQKNPNFSS